MRQKNEMSYREMVQRCHRKDRLCTITGSLMTIWSHTYTFRSDISQQYDFNREGFTNKAEQNIKQQIKLLEKVHKPLNCSVFG